MDEIREAEPRWSPSASDHADVTPKPLRIFKRISGGSTTPSRFSSGNTESTLDASPTSTRSFFRHRRTTAKSGFGYEDGDSASIISTVTFEDLPARRLSPSPANADILTVRKMRRGGTRYSRTTAAARSLSLFSQDSRHHTDLSASRATSILSQPLGAMDDDPFVSNPAPHRIARVSDRASTVGDYRQLTSHVNRGGSLTLPSLTLSSIRNHRRSQSARELESGQLPQLDLVGLDGSRHARRQNGQLTSKHRFFNKVLSGFGARTNAQRALMEIPSVRESWPPRLYNSHESIPQGLRPHSRATTMTSIATESSLESSLDRAIAAFPSPPKSNVTSATTTASIDMIPAVRTPTILSTSRDLPVIGAELRLTPEKPNFDANGAQYLYVAVEAEGVLQVPQSQDCLLSLETRLDVVVVIDNSSFTSPATLMASCEATSFIASILDETCDRLAVICTHVSNPDSIGNIFPLGKINPRQTRGFVDQVVSTSGKPEATNIGLAIEKARNLLGQSTLDVGNSKGEKETQGHVIVLTSNSGVDLNDVVIDDGEDKVQLHFVSTGILPWPSQHEEHLNGWRRLSSLSSKGNVIPHSIHRAGQTEISEALRALVLHARSGASCGRLKQLTLELKPGPNCTIEGIMGRCKFEILRPAELSMVLVKVKVNTIPARSSTSPSIPPTPRTTSQTPNLWKELEVMLEDSSVVVLTARLNYGHSSLPIGTECSINSEARVQKQLVAPDRSCMFSNTSPRNATNTCGDSSELQKKVVYCLAVHHAPRHALKTLRKEFGQDGSLSACPKYIQLVTEELKYQARIIERYELPGGEPHKVKFAVDEITPVADRRSSTVQINPSERALSDISNIKPRNWFPAIEVIPRDVEIPRLVSNHAKRNSKEISRHPSGGRTVSRHTAKWELPDEAHRIWGEIRKKSKSLGVPKAVSKHRTSEEKLRQIQELALKNKRSIGADTLKSIHLNGSEASSSAPWL